MVKLVTLLLIQLISYSALAEIDDPSCEKSPLSSDIESLANSLQVPNCNNRKTVNPAMKGDFEKLCKECEPSFQEALKKNSDLNVTSENLDLGKIALNELKRSLSAQMLNIVNLRSVFTTSADFKDAIVACSIDDFVGELGKKDCTKNINLRSLKTQLQKELGHLVNTTTEYDNKGILNRDRSKTTCDIPDSSILRAKSLALEEYLDDDAVGSILSIKAEDKDSFELALSQVSGKSDFPLVSSLSSHPLFSQLTPHQKLMSFLKTLKRPVDVKQLRSSMYTNKTANDSLAKSIASRCRAAFKGYESLACNKDVKAGKVGISSLKDAGIFMPTIQTTTKKFIDLSKSTELKENLELLKICNIRSDKKDALNFTQKLSEISSFMPDDERSLPYEEYRTQKYENDIGNIRKDLCNIMAGKAKCEAKDYSCRLLSILDEEKKENSPISNLAKSSDKNVNALLRSFIGSPVETSGSTHATLVKAGIFPKNDKGQLAEQPKVPEREPDFVAKMAEEAKSSDSATAPTATSAPTAPGKATAPSKNGTPFTSPTSGTSASASAVKTPAKTPDPKTNDPEMTAINEEILRRLQDKQDDSGKPVSTDEARKTVREVFKEKGRPLTEAQEYSLAHQAKTDSKMAGNPTFAKSSDANISPGDDPKKQWEKEQKLRALEGMQGAQATAAAEAAARGPASVKDGADAEGKKLSKVALTIGEDKIKLNLSDVLDEKILKNDSDGKILKVFIQNKKDFILEVNSTSFKVKFDKEKKIYTVSFDSGDSKEAERLRPQLEKFFNRVNAYAMQ